MSRLWQILEPGRPGDRTSHAFDVCLLTLIAVNVAAFIAESVRSVDERYGWRRKSWSRSVFEGIIRDPASGRLTLRDPKLVVLRADKSAHEADATKAIEELYLKQKVG